jgi:hypothetical protein
VPAPSEIVHNAKPGQTVVGWKLDRTEREALLAQFPPHYPNTIADHVTLAPKVARATSPPDDTDAKIVGHVDDGEGLEALVVAIDGSSNRPDGSIFHITWSLRDGRRPKESNDVLAQRGWQRLDKPIPISLKGARF